MSGVSTRDGLGRTKGIKGLAVGVRVVLGMLGWQGASAWKYFPVIGS